jgi:hypothetical protein
VTRRVQHRAETYRKRAAELRSAGLAPPSAGRTRSRFSPSQKSAITRAWNKLERFLSDDLQPVKVKRSEKTGDRPRAKNTIFVAREGFDRIEKKRGEIVKSRKRGRVTERLIEKVDASARDVLGQVRAQRRRKAPKKGTRRYTMLRRADSVNPAGMGRYESPEMLEKYLRQLGGRVYRKEVARLKASGYSHREAQAVARFNSDAVVGSLVVVEYETDADD